MPYIYGSDHQWHYTPDPHVAAQAQSEGYSVSDTLPTGGTVGAPAGGGVAVNPDIPTEEWALDYLLQTGQLKNAMAQTGVNAGQLGVNAFNAQAGLVGNVLQAYPAFRGPNNFAQYANFVTGTPGAGIPQFLAAAAGLAGGLNYGALPRGGVEPLTMPDVQSLMQPPKQQSAGKTLTDSINAGGNAPRTQQAGQQGALPAAAVSDPTSLAVKAPVGGGPGQVYNAALGRWTSQIPGAVALPAGAPGTAATHTPAAASNGTASVNPTAAGFDARTSPLSSFPATYGRTAVNTPAQMGSTAGISAGSGDKSDIKWKRDYHAAIEQAGFGHGSEARARANAAAGMSEAQAAHEIKHGRNPYTGIHAAEGMASVVTGPTTQRLGNTTLHTGEGGADELHIVIPLERKDQPIPAWALQLADALSPDKDHLRGVGGVTTYGDNDPNDPRGPSTIRHTPLRPIPANGGAPWDPWSGVFPPTLPVDPSVYDPPGLNKGRPPNPGGYHMAEGGAIETQGGRGMPRYGNSNVSGSGLPARGVEVPAGTTGPFQPMYGGQGSGSYGPAEYTPSVGGLAGGESAIPASAQGRMPKDPLAYSNEPPAGGMPRYAPEQAVAPQNLPRAGGGYGGTPAWARGTAAPVGGGEYTPPAPSIDPVLLGKAARWWAAQHGGSAADGLAALQLPENAAYLESALGMAGAGEIDAILGPERPITAPAPATPARADPANVAATRDPDWQRRYMAQQTGRGDYAGAVMGGVNGGLALAPGRVTTASTPVHLAQGGMLLSGPSDPLTPGDTADPALAGDVGAGMVGQGSFDPTDPHPSPEALIEIRAELSAPPAANPTPLEQAIRANWTLDGHGHPLFIGATTPDQAMHSGVPGWAQPQPGDSLHMAQGGVAVIDAGGTIKQANKPFSGSGTNAVYTNASGQIQAPSRKPGKFTTIPAWKGSPLAQPTTANASVMNRIINTPSLKQAMESTWGARGLIPEDMWAQYLNGLKLVGNAPAAGRIGAGF